MLHAERSKLDCNSSREHEKPARIDHRCRLCKTPAQRAERGPSRNGAARASFHGGSRVAGTGSKSTPEGFDSPCLRPSRYALPTGSATSLRRLSGEQSWHPGGRGAAKCSMRYRSP